MRRDYFVAFGEIEDKYGLFRSLSKIYRAAWLLVLPLMVFVLGGCIPPPTPPPPTPTIPPYSECTCSTSMPAPSSSERIIDDKTVVLPNLECWARVTALHDSSNNQSSYRAVVHHSSGNTCDWSALQEADRVVGEEVARNQMVQSVDALPANYEGNVLVWRKDGPPTVEKGLTKVEVKALLDQPQVGRVSIPPARLVEVIELQGGHCSCAGPPLSFSMGPVTEASTYGQGATVGILESSVYNNYDEDVGEPIFDERVQDPIASLQMGHYCGMFGCDYHANIVASQMWAKCCGYIHNSNPISVGVGTSGSAADFFERYLKAFEFFKVHGVKIINSSIYFPRDTVECEEDATRDYELLQDYYQYRYGMLLVQAAGNGVDKDNEYDSLCIRVANALSVGSYRADTSQTANMTFYNAGSLEIPSLVGGCNQQGDENDIEGAFVAWDPRQEDALCMFTGNSLNAPAASSLAAIIATFGQKDANALATTPQVLRAILMASANYSEDLSGSDTSPACTGCTTNTTCNQTDCRFGAGQLNGSNALRVYQTGDYNLWEAASQQWQQSSEPFSCEPPGCLVKGAIAWANAVDCDNAGCSGDGHISHDFDLVLEQRINGVWTPIREASSRESTTEWLQMYVWVNDPTNNQFRFAIWEVGRRVARPTQVGFAAFFGDQLRVPEKDRTLPTVNLDVNVNGHHYTNLGSEHIIGLDDIILLTANGEDLDAGLNWTSIDGDIVVSCRNGNLGQSRRSHIVIYEPQKHHNHESGDTAKTKLSAGHSFQPSNYANSCSPGYTLTSVRGELRAVVENALNVTVESNRFRFFSEPQ